MNSPVDRPDHDEILQQARAIQEWLMSNEGRECAERLLRRVSLPPETAEDLVNDTWLKIEKAFARRAKPLTSNSGGRTEVRYAQRALEFAAIDALRAQIRRERLADDIATLNPPTAVEVMAAEDRALHLISTQSMIDACRDPEREVSCPGCRPDLVREVAVRTLVSLDVDRTQHLDVLIYEALTALLGVNDGPVKPDALRARKARCAPCVIRLLREVARDVSSRPDHP